MSAPKSQEEAEFQRWNIWLDEIRRQVVALATNRYIFLEIRRIYLGNPELQWDDTVLAWMAEAHAHASVLAVRRLSDIQDESISFSKLISQILKAPHILSRERYVRLYNGTPRGMGDRDYDSLWGTGALHANPGAMQEDLNNITAKAARIRGFADKRIAHHDKAFSSESIPSWKELDECLACLETLLKKYLLAFRAEAHVTVVPVWQYDWQKVFQIPWLPGRPHQDSL